MAKSPRKTHADAGRIVRPPMEVLGSAALIPPGKRVKPAPNQFTHVVARAQPYSFDESDPPIGEFQPGTRVVLMVYDGGAHCRVIDSQGLYVVTAYEGLEPIDI